MGVEIGQLAVRRSIFIKAPPERVWREFESLERMQAWFGTGHTLLKYEPRVGGWVELEIEPEGNAVRFGGRVTVFEPPRELTFENDWLSPPDAMTAAFGEEWRTWAGPSLITLRLTPALGGTVVELFHHGFERSPDKAAEMLRGYEGGWTIRQLDALRQIVEAA